MKGHVRARSNKKWEFVIPVGKNLDGSRKRITGGGFADKEKAEEAMVKKMYEINAGLFIEPSKETVFNFFSTWIAQKKSQLRTSTYSNYLGYFNNHIAPNLGNILLSKLTTQHIQQLYMKMNQTNSPRTVKHLHTMLKQGLGRAVKLNIIAKNPAEDCMLPKIENEPFDCWNAEELRQFLDFAKSSRWYLAFLIAAYTGARLGEVLALRWENIDFSKGTVTIKNALTRKDRGFQLGQTKTRSSIRQIRLPATVIQELLVLKNVLYVGSKKSEVDARVFNNPKDFIVHTFDGNYLSPHNFVKTWRKLVRESGLRKIRFHDLRHTHATLLLEAGINMKAVSRRLGHSTVNMTLDTYSHVTPQMEEGITLALEQLLA
ncbi:tyrosine-type recombinase/integrase [Cohnella abietis]|uniref:Site-specific integrase n=1 Tax=Cohnella abietis TaxID=2507935 RepID=A0A3T1CY35_9BACL|nr:tyrosine-type recombinase/integrase [Cohnella abietis]BBI30753.1 site-specific integrase [Cohnella abietis]